MGSDDQQDAMLDAQGLKCPLPVLRARKAIKSVEIGGELTVLATDPAAPKDFKAFSEQAGHELVSSAKTDDVFTFVLRRGR
ncbi:MAG: sulfurtransferase TusA family protein [Alphaproteobacteria bacterium]|nr:sulfurtransferase TusA family protein [Alphaproteobacteria bacterium]